MGFSIRCATSNLGKMELEMKGLQPGQAANHIWGSQCRGAHFLGGPCTAGIALNLSGVKVDDGKMAQVQTALDAGKKLAQIQGE